MADADLYELNDALVSILNDRGIVLGDETLNSLVHKVDAAIAEAVVEPDTEPATDMSRLRIEFDVEHLVGQQPLASDLAEGIATNLSEAWFTMDSGDGYALRSGWDCAWISTTGTPTIPPGEAVVHGDGTVTEHVTLAITYDPNDQQIPPAQWDWPNVADMAPDTIEVIR